jgi:DNA-binding MarR family transcriptional regulator
MPRYECLVEATSRLPDLEPLACDLYLRILFVADALHRVDEAALARHGMSPARFAVLMLLWDPGKAFGGEQALPQVELADRACVSRATMTGLIDGLEHDGFVERRDDPDDRRVALVTLTDAGRARLEAMMPPYLRHVSAVMAGLSERDRQGLQRALVRLQEGLEGLHAAGAAGGATDSRKETKS